MHDVAVDCVVSLGNGNCGTFLPPSLEFLNIRRDQVFEGGGRGERVGLSYYHSKIELVNIFTIIHLCIGINRSKDS